ncbi:unnamed protein product, partial [Allacma fusca]
MEEIFVRVGEAAKKPNDKIHSQYQLPKSEPPIEERIPSPNYSVENLFTRVDSLSHLYRTERERNEGKALLWQQLKAMLIKKFLVNARKWSVATLQVIVPPVMTLLILTILQSFPTFKNPTSLEISFKAYERVGLTTVLFNCVPESNLCSSFESFMNKSRRIEEIPDTSMVSFLLDE